MDGVLFAAALMVPGVWVGIVLQLVDVGTTVVIVDRRGGVERNPVVAHLMGLGGRAWWVVKLAITIPATMWCARYPTLLWLLNICMAGVVIHNFRHMRD
ncbi:DUF5658 family protein [Limimaricola variabilis]